MESKIVVQAGRLTTFRMPVQLFKDGNQYVADCGALGLASHGKTISEAKTSLKNVIEVFIEEVIEMGTLDKVMTERGWTRKTSGEEKYAWMPPRVTQGIISSASGRA
jgi:predicted RNase H-like HicB family nuclease